MKLTEEQEEKIQNLVDKEEFKLESLRNDIVDHLCCVIEFELGNGKSFDLLLEESIKELAPNGLSELEHQTLFLFNSKRIILMKRLLYIIGLIGSIMLTAGMTFKLLSMPYGNQLFMIGFLSLLLIFVPLLAFDRYKVVISKTISERMKLILGVTAAVITGLSGVFKLLHLQGAVVLLFIGAFIFAVGFLPFLFFTMYKKSVL